MKTSFLLFLVSFFGYSQSMPCSEAVFNIVKSSKSYKWATYGLEKKVIANGGTGIGFMCESEPDKENPKYEVYDVNLHENYPDHFHNFRFYVFKARTLSLFEYDVVNDKLLPIKYNKALLADFKKKCFKE